MEIVDSQNNVPSPGPGWDRALDEKARVAATIEIVVTGMDAVGIDSVVLVSPPAFSDAAIAAYPRRFAALLAIPADAPDMAERVASVRARPGFLGVRVIATGPTAPSAPADLRAGKWEPAFAAAERQGIPLAIFASGDLDVVAPIAEAHPDLALIVDHLGISAPPLMKMDAPPFKQLATLLALGRYPNVCLKMSGTPALSLERYPFLDLWPSLHRIIDAFGPERLMWGSDFPRCSGLHTRAEAVAWLRFTHEVTEREKELMFGMNLRRIMRWSRPS